MEQQKGKTITIYTYQMYDGKLTEFKDTFSVSPKHVAHAKMIVKQAKMSGDKNTKWQFD